MLGVRHPFTRDLYEKDEHGNVVVTSSSDPSVSGTFTSKGRWLDGALRECDPQLCGWVAGPIVGNHRIVESAPTVHT
jgi:hypothetical protein